MNHEAATPATPTPPGLAYRCGYYHDPALRRALQDFAREAFPGLDFAPWEALGGDLRAYTPFSFFAGGDVVANVSASPMELVVNGLGTAAVQIGTVASRPDFRGRGLVRALMARATEHWGTARDLFFLFTNPRARDFYRQFGYRQVREHRFRAKAPARTPPAAPARRLDLTSEVDRELLRGFAARRAPVSDVLGVHRDAWLLLFHAAVAHPQRLFHVAALDAIVIAAAADQTLQLLDVIAERIPALDELYPYVGSPDIEAVEFLFTPDKMNARELTAEPDPDSLLFVRGDFPIGREPFRFPATSQA